MAHARLTIAAMMMSISSLALAQSAPPVPAAPGGATDATVPAAVAPAMPAMKAPGRTMGTAAVSTPTAITPAPDAQQKLTDRLQAAGYSNVKVMPESFVIQATDKSGRPVSIFLEHGEMVVFATADAITAAAKPGTTGIFTEIPVNEDLSSKLIGLDIHNAARQKIGTIKDVAFGNNGVKAYIVAVGGFLGMGDRYVAIVPSAIRIGFDGSDKKWHATMETTAAELKAAPEYKYSSKS